MSPLLFGFLPSSLAVLRLQVAKWICKQSFFCKSVNSTHSVSTDARLHGKEVENEQGSHTCTYIHKKTLPHACWFTRTQEKYKLYTPVRENLKPAKRWPASLHSCHRNCSRGGRYTWSFVNWKKNWNDRQTNKTNEDKLNRQMDIVGLQSQC